MFHTSHLVLTLIYNTTTIFINIIYLCLWIMCIVYVCVCMFVVYFVYLEYNALLCDIWLLDVTSSLEGGNKVNCKSTVVPLYTRLPYQEVSSPCIWSQCTAVVYSRPQVILGSEQ